MQIIDQNFIIIKFLNPITICGWQFVKKDQILYPYLHLHAGETDETDVECISIYGESEEKSQSTFIRLSNDINLNMCYQPIQCETHTVRSLLISGIEKVTIIIYGYPCTNKEATRQSSIDVDIPVNNLNDHYKSVISSLSSEQLQLLSTLQKEENQKNNEIFTINSNLIVSEDYIKNLFHFQKHPKLSDEEVFNLFLQTLTKCEQSVNNDAADMFTLLNNFINIINTISSQFENLFNYPTFPEELNTKFTAVSISLFEKKHKTLDCISTSLSLLLSISSCPSFSSILNEPLYTYIYKYLLNNPSPALLDAIIHIFYNASIFTSSLPIYIQAQNNLLTYLQSLHSVPQSLPLYRYIHVLIQRITLYITCTELDKTINNIQLQSEQQSYSIIIELFKQFYTQLNEYTQPNQFELPLLTQFPLLQYFTTCLSNSALSASRDYLTIFSIIKRILLLLINSDHGLLLLVSSSYLPLFLSSFSLSSSLYEASYPSLSVIIPPKPEFPALATLNSSIQKQFSSSFISQSLPNNDNITVHTNNSIDIDIEEEEEEEENNNNNNIDTNGETNGETETQIASYIEELYRDINTIPFSSLLIILYRALVIFSTSSPSTSLLVPFEVLPYDALSIDLFTIIFTKYTLSNPSLSLTPEDLKPIYPIIFQSQIPRCLDILLYVYNNISTVNPQIHNQLSTTPNGILFQQYFSSTTFSYIPWLTDFIGTLQTDLNIDISRDISSSIPLSHSLSMYNSEFQVFLNILRFDMNIKKPLFLCIYREMGWEVYITILFYIYYYLLQLYASKQETDISAEITSLPYVELLLNIYIQTLSAIISTQAYIEQRNKFLYTVILRVYPLFYSNSIFTPSNKIYIDQVTQYIVILERQFIQYNKSQQSPFLCDFLKKNIITGIPYIYIYIYYLATLQNPPLVPATLPCLPPLSLSSFPALHSAARSLSLLFGSLSPSYSRFVISEHLNLLNKLMNQLPVSLQSHPANTHYIVSDDASFVTLQSISNLLCHVSSLCYATIPSLSLFQTQIDTILLSLVQKINLYTYNDIIDHIYISIMDILSTILFTLKELFKEVGVETYMPFSSFSSLLSFLLHIPSPSLPLLLSLSRFLYISSTYPLLQQQLITILNSLSENIFYSIFTAVISAIKKDPEVPRYMYIMGLIYIMKCYDLIKSKKEYTITSKKFIDYIIESKTSILRYVTFCEQNELYRDTLIGSTCVIKNPHLYTALEQYYRFFSDGSLSKDITSSSSSLQAIFILHEYIWIQDIKYLCKEKTVTDVMEHRLNSMARAISSLPPKIQSKEPIEQGFWNKQINEYISSNSHGERQVLSSMFLVHKEFISDLAYDSWIRWNCVPEHYYLYDQYKYYASIKNETEIARKRSIDPDIYDSIPSMMVNSSNQNDNGNVSSIENESNFAF
ncbi:hypothetical protein WA158_004142 [Blastocystis sp. Blastoise]